MALGVCCVLWAIVSMVAGSNVGLTVFALLVLAYGAAIVIVVWAVVLLIARRNMLPLQRPWREPLVVFGVLALVYLDLPFYVRFFSSEPFLDQYVQSVAAVGRPRQMPHRVGLFTIREAEVLPTGVVRIITTDCMFDDCGLAFSRVGQPPLIEQESYRQVAGRWWQWRRSER